MNLQTFDYTPTPEHRRLVESTAGLGLPPNDIASLIGVDEATLFQHYASEMEVGRAKANAQIAKTIYSKAQEGDATSLKIWSDNQEKIKRVRGRPKGSFKTPMHHLAENLSPGAIQKSDNQKLKELKKILLDSAGTNVVSKAIEIALNDDHPSQAAMIKLCLDRLLPVSMFEKEKNIRSAVSITISGLGEVSHNNEKIIDMDSINERP